MKRILATLSSTDQAVTDRAASQQMLSITSTILLIFFGLSVTAAGAYAVNRIWPIDARRTCNDAIGCQLNVLGTTYAVVLGFMLFNVWSEFRTSSLNVSAEASTVLELYRFTKEAAPEAKVVLQGDLHAYIDEVVTREWPAMHLHRGNSLPTEGDQIVGLMIHHLETLNSVGKNQDLMESSLVRLQELRRLREEEYIHTMPTALWIILLSGAILVIGCVSLLGGESLPLYYTQVFSLALVILAILTAIADIDHPFSGSVTVAPAAFEHVRSLMF